MAISGIHFLLFGKEMGKQLELWIELKTGLLRNYVRGKSVKMTKCKLIC